MSRRQLLACASLAPLAGWLPARGNTQRRVALVIGNARYAQAALANPENDARLVAQTLRSLGFKVEERLNLKAEEFRRTLRRFSDLMLAENTALVFYYAGHGMQLEGRNYLLPVNLNLRDEREIRDEAIDLEQALRPPADGRNHNQVRIYFIDACRDNPFQAAPAGGRAARGLAELNLPAALVVYSTAPGQTVDDGPPGSNSLFSRILAEEMRTEGLLVEAMMKNVLVRVHEASGGKQLPFQNNTLLADFQFRPGPVVARAPVPLAEPPAPTLASLPAPAAGPRQVALQVQADRLLNTDRHNTPASLALRLYLLRDGDSFSRASFDNLYDRDEATLGAALLGRESLHLRPGETRELALALPPGAAWLAVFAAYRELGQARWRTSMALPPQLPAQPLRLQAQARQVLLGWAP